MFWTFAIIGCFACVASRSNAFKFLGWSGFVLMLVHYVSTLQGPGGSYLDPEYGAGQVAGAIALAFLFFFQIGVIFLFFYGVKCFFRSLARDARDIWNPPPR